MHLTGTHAPDAYPAHQDAHLQCRSLGEGSEESGVRTPVDVDPVGFLHLNQPRFADALASDLLLHALGDHHPAVTGDELQDAEPSFQREVTQWPGVEDIDLGRVTHDT